MSSIIVIITCRLLEHQCCTAQDLYVIMSALKQAVATFPFVEADLWMSEMTFRGKNWLTCNYYNNGWNWLLCRAVMIATRSWSSFQEVDPVSVSNDRLSSQTKMQRPKIWNAQWWLSPRSENSSLWTVHWHLQTGENVQDNDKPSVKISTLYTKDQDYWFCKAA